MQVAETWYEARSFPDGITRIRESHVAPWLRCNIWHVRGRDRDLVIDTGMGLRPLTKEVAQLSGRPVTAIVTHTHFDHSAGLHQFADRRCHPAEAALIADPTPETVYHGPPFVRAETFTALPYEGFDHRSYEVRPADPTGLLDEGDVLDLGDRVFRVLHLPGHSPGSIALWEAATETLFSGDAVYDGDLIDNMPHSDAAVYAETMARLKAMRVRAVHAGHLESFDKAGMDAIIDEYLAGGRRIVDAEAWLAARIG